MDYRKRPHGSANSGPVLPPAMLGEEETALIVTVKGASDLRQHLSTLGFVEGRGKELFHVSTVTLLSASRVLSGLNRPNVVAHHGSPLALLYCAAGNTCGFYRVSEREGFGNSEEVKVGRVALVAALRVLRAP